MNRKEPSAPVPERDKQAEEDLWQRHKAERGVWTEPMLAALAGGLSGQKWFSLIDTSARAPINPSRSNGCGLKNLAARKSGRWEYRRLPTAWCRQRLEWSSSPFSHFDFLGYRFQRSRRGRMMRLVRPKSLRKLRETIKPRTRRANGRSMEAIVADLNRTLPGWFGYFKHAKASELSGIDGWIRMRLRSILRKRRGLEGRGRGIDHQRWPNRYFKKLGLFCLLDARETEIASLHNGANC